MTTYNAKEFLDLVREGSEEQVKKFLQNYINDSDKDKPTLESLVDEEGNNALHIVIKETVISRDRRKTKIASLLKDSPINIIEKNNNKETPIHIANKNGLHDIGAYLCYAHKNKKIIKKIQEDDTEFFSEAYTNSLKTAAKILTELNLIQKETSDNEIDQDTSLTKGESLSKIFKKFRHKLSDNGFDIDDDTQQHIAQIQHKITKHNA